MKMNMKSKRIVKILAIALMIAIAIAMNISIAYAFFFEPPLQEYIEQTNIQKDEAAVTEMANIINIRLMDDEFRIRFAGDYDCERSITITFIPASIEEEKTTYNLSDGIVNFSSRNDRYLIDYEEMYQYLFDNFGETFEVVSDKYQGSTCVIIIDMIPENYNRPIYVYSIFKE